jgi:hypothetical protein
VKQPVDPAILAGQIAVQTGGDEVDDASHRCDNGLLLQFRGTGGA